MRFFPPHYSLKFKYSSEAGEDRLLKSYIRKEQAPRKIARTLMGDDLTAFFTALETKGEVVLPGVGVFKDTDSGLKFTSILSLNPNLPILKLEPLSREEIVEQQPQQQVQQNIAVAEIVPEPETVPEQIDEREANSFVTPVKAPESASVPERETVPEPIVDLNHEIVQEEVKAPVPVDSGDLDEKKESVSASQTENETALGSGEGPAAEKQETADSGLGIIDEGLNVPSSEISEERKERKRRRKYKIPPGYYYHKPEYYYVPIHKKFALIAACLLLVAIVFITAMMPVMNSPKNSSAQKMNHVTLKQIETNKDTTTSLPSIPKVKEEAKPKLAEKNKAVPERRPENKLKENYADTSRKNTVEINKEGDTIPPENHRANPVASSLTPDKYFAVVGAFKTMKEVEKFLKTNQRDKSKITVLKNKNINLVAVSSAQTKEALEDQMPLIRVSYPDAWIYTKK